MHDTALAHAEGFFELYGQRAATAFELGSRNVNGSLRSVCPARLHYTGADMEAGSGVDVVVAPGDALPFPDGAFDLVLSSSCLEHDPCFWETFLELMRVLAPGGCAYLNVPSNGRYHRHPLDCWRFYPDAGLALALWAQRKGLRVHLVESFVASRRDAEWNDAVMIFALEPFTQPRRFLADHSPGAHNIRRLGYPQLENVQHATEDQRLMQHFAAQCGVDIDLDACATGGVREAPSETCGRCGQSREPVYRSPEGWRCCHYQTCDERREQGRLNRAVTIAELVALLQAVPDQSRPVWCSAEAGCVTVEVRGIEYVCDDHLLLRGD